MEQKFLELETNWMNAWKNKDEAAARKIIADEFTLTSSLSTGELVDKDEWIERVLRKLDCKVLRIDKLQARVYNKTAVLNIWFHQEAIVNGKDWNGNFLLTDVWVQKNENWQVVARHASWLQKE
ncbi:MAG TPA: nuclear transport factor 2 family protein [Chitinophagaceae bacterium]|nr:nuclear transport factor 2 family protein [Chitinophagaceae bacterium]